MRTFFNVFALMGLVVLAAASVRATQFDVLDPGYNQQIYTGPLQLATTAGVAGEGGMAWIGSGTGSILLTRAGSDIFEHSLTQNVTYQGTPLHGVVLTHSISGLNSSGYAMTNGTDGYIYAATGSGLQRFNPSNWSAPAQSLGSTIGGAGYGITTLPDGRSGYSDGGASSNIYIYNPSTATNTLVYTTTGEQVDGIQAGPTGDIALALHSPTWGIAIITSSGSLVNSFSTAHAPDGLAFGDGAASSSLFSNNNDGTISEYALSPSYTGSPLITDIAQQTIPPSPGVGGKAYGDLAAVGPDCAFYVTQFNNGGQNGSTNGVGTHWDNGVTNGDASIVRISAVIRNSDGTVGETCGFYSPTEAVPEPGTLALLVAGAGILAFCSRIVGTALFRKKRC